MKIRVTVTLDVDPATWADEYGVARDEVRADVRAKVGHDLYEHYVGDLGIARDVTVT